MTPTPRERVFAAQRGETLDRPPFAVWRHFYSEERPGRARELAQTLTAFVRRHELDLLKYNPRAHYHAEPWGTRYRYPAGDARPVLERYAVNGPEDWRRIERRDSRDPVLAEMLEGVRIACEEVPDVPVLMTIFTPLSILERLGGRERVLSDLRERPSEVRLALEAVTQTFAELARSFVDASADGIFLATTDWAQRDVLRDDEYSEFGRPFDLRILDAVRDAPFNVLHVCGENSRVFELADYPAAAVSWNARATGNSDIGRFLERVRDRVAIGGYSDEVFTSLDETRLGLEGNSFPLGDRRWIAAGGCTIPTTSDSGLIDLARDSLRVRLGAMWTR